MIVVRVIDVAELRFDLIGGLVVFVLLASPFCPSADPIGLKWPTETRPITAAMIPIQRNDGRRKPLLLYFGQILAQFSSDGPGISRPAGFDTPIACPYLPQGS